MKKIMAFVLALLLILCGLYLVNAFSYSSGIRSGKLVKLSKKGLLFKTYEGTLDLGSGDQLTWGFSVRDSKVGKMMLNNIGQYVELKYDEKLLKLFYKTKYDVVDMKISKSGPLGNIVGNSGSDLFCMFAKEIAISSSLKSMIDDHLAKRQSVFQEKFKVCFDKSSN